MPPRHLLQQPSDLELGAEVGPGPRRLSATQGNVPGDLEMFDPRVWCNLFQRLEGCAMGQVLHGSATTTEAVRRAIQNSQESLRTLARRYGINQKTVRKWRNR